MGTGACRTSTEARCTGALGGAGAGTARETTGASVAAAGLSRGDAGAETGTDVVKRLALAAPVMDMAAAATMIPRFMIAPLQGQRGRPRKREPGGPVAIGFGTSRGFAVMRDGRNLGARARRLGPIQRYLQMPRAAHTGGIVFAKMSSIAAWQLKTERPNARKSSAVAPARQVSRRGQRLRMRRGVGGLRMVTEAR